MAVGLVDSARSSKSVMLDIMYELPTMSDVRECIITEECVTNKEPPLLVYEKRPAS